ncbi:MAG: hybrid sensor histidine kinase/response regulator [Blastocatellia bacterium]
MIYQWHMESNQINHLRGGAALFGYPFPAAGISRDDWIELIHPEDQAKVQERIAAALERGDESYQIEYRLRRHNGDYPAVCEAGWITRDEMGQAQRVLCRVTEGAVRQREEEWIVRRGRKFKVLAKQSPEIISRLDRELRHVYFNSAIERILGLRARDYLGKKASECGLPLGAPWIYEEKLLSAFLSGEEERFEFSFSTGDQTSHYETLLIPELDEQGAVESLLSVTCDITARKQVEEKWRDSDERLHQILEATEVGAWQWDLLTGGFTWYGKTADLLGVQPKDIAGTYEASLKIAHPDDRGAIKHAVKRSIETGAEFRVEFRVIRPQGGARWLLAKGQVYTNAQGAPERMMGIIYDITPRKQVEEARQELLAQEQAARAEAEAAAQAKDEFLAVISHELRTPLSAMLGWAEVLRSRQPGDSVYERALQTIERNAERQSQLIEDLLDTTRILSGKLRIEAQPLYLDALLEESLDVVRPAAEAKEIEMSAAFDTGANLIMGDANRLQQVFWNLLSNAIKFTEPGGRVEVRLERENAEAKIIVRDTGKGITPDFLPHVFDLFRQADSSSARRQGGLGLGLALARRLVEMHGGTIRVNSSGEGQGATFTINLPARSGNRTTTEMKAVEIKKTLNASGKPSLDGLRILVVDDEADARDLLAIRLQQYGADVITAASVEAALELLTQLGPRPDLIVSDIAMPGEDGYSLMRRVRALELEQGGRIPAIALTAYSRTKDRVQALAAGFQLHVPKPVNAAELAHAIASIAGRFSPG